MTTTRTLLATLVLATAAACGGEAPLQDSDVPSAAQQARAARARTSPHPTYDGPVKLDPKDIITAAELDRARGGYSLEVPGVGKVILDNTDPRVTSGCALHRPTLISEIQANPPTASGHQWINWTIYYTPMTGTLCMPPANGACYKMVRFAAP